METRKRALPGASLSGAYTSRRIRKVSPRPSTTTQRYEAPTYNLLGEQITASEGHPFRSRSGNLTDLGGPFRTQKLSVDVPSEGTYVFPEAYSGGLDAFVQDTYHGRIYPYNPTSFPPSGESVDSELTKLGATAIARCKPTNSVANLATALGEIFREGLPHLVGSRTWQSRTLNARNAGEEYLNGQFGWRPLINDVTSFANGVVHADRILAQYERDAGKVVRRRYYFPQKKVVQQDVILASAYPVGPVNNPSNFATFGRVIRTRETVQRQWFSGAFTYALPSGLDSRSRMGRFALLADRLGLKLTPETLWNLTPWSWAADWFSNAGDVISNISDIADQGLVMRYGYIMEYSMVKDTYTLEGAVLAGGQPFSCDPLVLTNEVKIRKQANPYGFGVSWDTLSTFQLSILSALGITRRR